jgi:cytoplasmic tRNA 2-thiolation protein 1
VVPHRRSVVFLRLDYFSTECVYAPFAARGFTREFVKDLEATRPSAIIDLIHSAEQFRFLEAAEQRLPKPRTCDVCGFISSQPVCKACVLLEGLNKGRAKGSGRKNGGAQIQIEYA